MKVCARCVLPENFPGIRLDEEGVCNICRDFDPERLAAKKTECRLRFESLVKEHAGKADYDAILSYSGGKDSTFTLLLLKRDFNLNVLAFTLDNGFVSKRAAENISLVTRQLGVDHLQLRPSFDLMRTIFSECSRRNIFPLKTLERASPICTACMSIVRFSALRLAIEKKIPFVVYGWSPGQAPVASSILRNNPAILKLMQNSTLRPLQDLVGDAVNPYFLSPEHLASGADLPFNIHPLAFSEYEEKRIFEAIAKIGWKAPQDTDANSTNCLLNSFANHVHKTQFGFHPYSLELASLVRQGYLERGEALARLQDEDRAEQVSNIRSMLGLDE
jgi:tRNA(Ile)-lysidine synthase TilS/MesJ